MSSVRKRISNDQSLSYGEQNKPALDLVTAHIPSLPIDLDGSSPDPDYNFIVELELELDVEAEYPRWRSRLPSQVCCMAWLQVLPPEE